MRLVEPASGPLIAIERLPDIRQHNTLYNGLWRVPTLQDDIDQLRGLTMKYHRQIGIIPEIKHSTYFRSIGLPMEQRLLDVLRSNGLDHHSAPVIIQSFEVGNLRWLHQHTRLRLMQLTSPAAPPPTTATPLPNTHCSSVLAWTGYSATTPIPPSPRERCGSPRAGRTSLPNPVDGDGARRASQQSGGVATTGQHSW